MQTLRPEKPTFPLVKTASRCVTRSLGALLLGCAALAAHAADPKELSIYNWSNYIAEDTIKNFEKETGIKVHYDTYDRDEVLNARLMIGGLGFDIIVPGADFAKTQIDDGLLQKLDRSKLTNWGNLDPAILNLMGNLDPGNQYLVNWLWGYVTVGINVNRVKAALAGMPMPQNPWSLVFDAKYASVLKSCGIGMLDSAAALIPPALAFIGKSPYSQNRGDYATVGAMLKTIRPFVKRFSSSGYIDNLADGSLCVAVGFSGDINIARNQAVAAKGVNAEVIEALIPATGSVLFFDSMAIPKDAKNVENAHLFINYILRPEVHASLTNEVFYANPNLASKKFVSKDVTQSKSVFLEPAAIKTMIVPQALSQNTRRIQTWTFSDFKNGF